MTATNDTMSVVQRWNSNHGPGLAVALTNDEGGEELTRTRSPARLLGGVTPVVLLADRVGAYALDRLEVLSTAWWSEGSECCMDPEDWLEAKRDNSVVGDVVPREVGVYRHPTVAELAHEAGMLACGWLPDSMREQYSCDEYAEDDDFPDVPDEVRAAVAKALQPWVDSLRPTISTPFDDLKLTAADYAEVGIIIDDDFRVVQLVGDDDA